MNWKKLDRALSALGVAMMGVGMLVKADGHEALLWYIALGGFFLKGAGAGLAYLLDDSDGSVPGLTTLGKLVIVLPLLLCLSGCQTSVAVANSVNDIDKSQKGVARSVASLIDLFCQYYTDTETARVDALDAKARASITKVVKTADGSTINYLDPGEGAALDKQHTSNLAQIGRKAGEIRAKLLATTTDAAHVQALVDGLKAYYAQKTNTETTINQGAAELLNIVEQYVPAPKAKK